jgi:hypothetical protein
MLVTNIWMRSFCRMLVLHRRLEISNAIRHQYLVVVIDEVLSGLCLMRGAEIKVTFDKPLQEIWTWLSHQRLTSSYKRKCEGI